MDLDAVALAYEAVRNATRLNADLTQSQQVGVLELVKHEIVDRMYAELIPQFKADGQH